MKNYAVIIVGGASVGLKFGIPCIRQLVEKNVVFQQTEEGKEKEYTELDIAHIFNAAYVNNCAVKEAIPSLTLEDFSDYVEESIFARNVDDIKLAMQTFADSKIIQDLAKIGGQQEDAEDKKKDLQLSGIT